jgi:hypothetical protein
MHEITWPDFGEVCLNSTRILELKPLQANSSVKKRKDEKYTTSDMSILSTNVNHLMIKESLL